MNRLLVIFILTGLISSCKPLFKVQSESISGMPPQKYNSFKFFNPQNMPESNFSFSDNNKKIIFDAVAREMKMRGFTSIQQSALIIKVQGGTSRQVENNTRNYYYDPVYGYNTFFGNPYYWSNDPWMNDDISRKRTTIIIDAIDAQSKKLIWEGVGTGVLGDKPEQVEQRIKDAITQIFSKFPIPAKSGG
jgi:Domain of unknown function (DUF4136)